MKYVAVILSSLISGCGNSPETNDDVAFRLCFDKMNTGEFSIKKTKTYPELDHWRFVYSIEINGISDYRHCTISKSDTRLPNPMEAPNFREFSIEEVPNEYPNRPAITTELNSLATRKPQCRDMEPASLMQWSEASGKHKPNQAAYWIMCDGETMTFSTPDN